MKIAILDGHVEDPKNLNWDGFKELGKLTIYGCTADPIEIVKRIGDAQMVYTNKVPITKEAIEPCRNLERIGVLAAGYNVVDAEAAREAGVIVTNIPACGSDAVSQLIIALLLELCHHIGERTECMRNGGWIDNPDWYFWDHPSVELVGKAMGIIGFGCIGQRTERIVQALEMKVLVHDTCKNKFLGSAACRYVEMDELLAVSDIVSLHCPLFPKTRGIINRESIVGMEDRTMIISNSRGQSIVEEGLGNALNSDKMAGAAVDVVSTEPIRTDNPLSMANNYIIIPHISWASKESRQRLMDTAVDNLKTYINGRSANVINE